MKTYSLDTRELFVGNVQIEAENKDEAVKQFFLSGLNGLNAESEGVEIVDIWEKQEDGSFIELMK